VIISLVSLESVAFLHNVVGTLQGIFATTNKIDEPGAALVLTLESTQVSACSCQSLVSKGRFQGQIYIVFWLIIAMTIMWMHENIAFVKI